MLMADPSSLLIFTDLDGTLLGTEDYAYEAALPILQRLKTEGIPVIPVTSKTRQEVETLRQRIGLSDPFITENGSAIFIPLDNPPFPLPEGEDVAGYRVLQLGCNYVTARAGLKVIAQTLGRPLKGFGDWSVEQIEQMTNLPHEDAKQAKAREFTEPFMTPKNVEVALLRETVEDMGFRVVIGGRFSHLIGGDAGKGLAVNQLATLYRSGLPEGQALTKVGLGNSPNDLDMLENVDIAVVIPEADGPHPQLADRGWRVAPRSAPQGWRLAVEALLDELS